MSLEYLKFKHSSSALWASIFFHGHGASKFDLAPLRKDLQFPHKTDWFFPEGPRALSPLGGRSWFSLEGEGKEHSLNLAREFLEELAPQYEGIYLGGFSQGGMVALELALGHRAVGGAVILSSALIAPLVPQNPHLNLFQSHGVNDGILPLHLGHSLRDFLLGHYPGLHYFEFEGGHEIPPSVVESANQVIQKWA